MRTMGAGATEDSGRDEHAYMLFQFSVNFMMPCCELVIE